MSGHSKWAKIKHKKAGTDAKRGAAFTKIIREITAAAKDGGGNPDTNPRLRTAVARARGINMQKDNIENAIKKGTGELPGVVYETAIFDAYGPGGVAILIDCLTDNKNRTTAEIRNILNKKNGNMAGAGATAYNFEKKGYITVEKNKIGEDDLYGLAIDVGADEFKAEGDTYEIFCEPSNFEAIKTAISGKIAVTSAEITMLPKSTVKVAGNDAKNVLELMETLEDHEDVQNVYANFDISEEDMAKMAGE